jgi:hypothetical protein
MEQSQDTNILNSISQKPKRGRPKKPILQSDTHISDTHTSDTHTSDTHTSDTHISDTHISDTHISYTHTSDINKKPRGRPKKGTLPVEYKQPDIPKKSKGRPKLFLTDEEIHAKNIRNKELTLVWKKNNSEQNKKLTSDCIKRASVSMKILKDLFVNNLIPDSHFQSVNELLKRKKKIHV